MSKDIRAHAQHAAGWLVERPDDVTFPRLYRTEAEAKAMVDYVNVNPGATMQPLYKAAATPTSAAVEPAQHPKGHLSELDQIAFELEEWIRQPDWAETFSLDDMAKWASEARPIHLVQKIRAIAATLTPAAKESIGSLEPVSPEEASALEGWIKGFGSGSQSPAGCSAVSCDDLGAFLHDYDYGADHEPDADTVGQYRCLAAAILQKFDVRPK